MSKLGPLAPDLQPPPESPAHVDPALAEQRRKLLEQVHAHLPAVKGFMTATGHIFTIDVFLAGVANRSVYLITGFVEALDKWNVFAAAPLVRLQVDSLLRVSYMTRAPRADAVADQAIKGRHFRSLMDADGKQLTGAHLLELAVPHHPWLRHVYSSANEWVHLSRSQVMAPWEFSRAAPLGTMSLRFPMQRDSLPPVFLKNMVAAMSEATDDLLSYMGLWRRR